MSKNNEKIKLHIQEDFFSKFSRKHLLLDTCVFIDALSHNEFLYFFKKCKENNITIVTIDPVIFEFIKGAENKIKLSNKKEFISRIVELILPLKNDLLVNFVPSLISKYKEFGRSLSIVDLLLAGTVQKHSRDLVLLTKNHKDFPLNIFNLESSIVVEMRRSLQVYGIYGFKEKL